MPDRLTSIRERLQAHGQAHVLSFVDQLTEAQRTHLLSQIERLRFAELDELIERYVRNRQTIDLPGDLEPAPYYPFDPSDAARGYDATGYRATGEEVIRQGKVAALTVAGGQGTRLGWNGPKGTYPATVVTGKPLFRIFAEQILAARRKYGVAVPWYIMTSPMNDAETRAFFADNNGFGLSRRDIFLFPQGVLPSFDAATGKLLLAEKHEIAVNPDGHGGAIKALTESGAIAHMRSRGVEHISYFQVDNPLVKAIDPLFIGLHVAAPDSSAEMSSKMVAKANAQEKVGVFCRTADKTIVVEYSDLPETLARETSSDGRLRFHAGSVAIHLMSVKFVEALTADTDHFALPYHRADKKAPYIDPDRGRRVLPAEPNAAKLESFIFDAIPFARSSIVYETTRVEEFAPIKNARGVDSPATSFQIQSDRHGAWLEAHGVRVPRTDDGHVNARIEISPLTALDPADLASIDLPDSVRPGQELLL